MKKKITTAEKSIQETQNLMKKCGGEVWSWKKTHTYRIEKKIRRNEKKQSA